MRLDKDFFIEIFSGFKRRKRSMILSGMGVFGAITLLIFLMSAGNGLENGVKNRFSSIKTNALYYYPNYTSSQFQQLPPNRKITFTYFDFLNLKSEFAKLVDVITCRFSYNGIKTLYNNSKTTTCNFAAVDFNNNQTRQVQMLRGEYVSERNFINKEKVIVLGKILENDLFGNQNALGKYIMMDNSYYKIIGICESLREGNASNYDNNLAIIPLSVYQSEFDSYEINSIELICSNPTLYDNVKYDVENYLKKIKFVNTDDYDAIQISDTKKEFEKYITLFQNIRYFLWFVSLSMLFMGMINVSNVVMITVTERLREIGIRKSMGATPSDIYYMIISESIILTLVSGILGIIFGVLLIKSISILMNKFNWNSEFFLNPYVNYGLIVYSLIILLVAGVISGFVPARRAAMIKPIEVLHHE
jgi:putative ABC transport system permease protein